MKKLLATAFAGAGLVINANGQGTVSFSNYFTGTASDPRAYFIDGGPPYLVSGSQYCVGLMAGPNAASLSLCATTSFLPGAGYAGYFIGPTVAIGGVAGGATAFIQIDVWDTTLNGTTTGATFEQAEAYAWAHRLAHIYGASSIFSVVTGNPNATPPGTPADLTGFTGALYSTLPEPSAFELAGLGIVGFLFFRGTRRQ